MTHEKLENLVKTKQLKREPATKDEIEGLVRAAKLKIRDAKRVELTLESRFELSYSSSHSLALAALRRCGYRSENRMIVFQCLPHTLELDRVHSRILSDIHNRRNLAAYEGETDVSLEVVESLIRTVDLLLEQFEKLYF